MKLNKYKKAFTLSEVIIVLIIIGLIASMIVPGLFIKPRKMQYRTSLKKALTNMKQAIMLEEATSGIGMKEITQNKVLFDNFMRTYFRIDEVKTGKGLKAFNETGYITMDGFLYRLRNGAYSWNGSTIDILSSKVCREDEGCYIYVDVNGSEKGPNLCSGLNANCWDSQSSGKHWAKKLSQIRDRYILRVDYEKNTVFPGGAAINVLYDEYLYK